MPSLCALKTPSSFDELLLEQFSMIEFPHLSSGLKSLLIEASRLGQTGCTKVAKLWCGSKGIGKTTLLKTLCSGNMLQRLAALTGERLRKVHLVAVYFDLGKHTPLHTMTFCETLRVRLLSVFGGKAADAALLWPGLDVGSLCQRLNDKHAFEDDFEDLGRLGIEKMNDLLSLYAVGVLCVVDEAEDLYKQTSFSERTSILWARDLLLLTGLDHEDGTNISIGAVLCCSLARSRQLFLREPTESAVSLGSEYGYESHIRNWNSTKLSSFICHNPTWTLNSLAQFACICLGKAQSGSEADSNEAVMDVLLRAAAEHKLADEVEAKPSDSGVAAGSISLTESAEPLQEQAVTSSSHSVSASPNGVDLTGQPMLSKGDALELMVVYTGGNHRALKMLIKAFSIKMYVHYDEAAQGFRRDAFVSSLDDIAMEHQWDVTKGLTDDDKRVILCMLSLVPQEAGAMNLSLSFDQTAFAVPKELLLSEEAGVTSCQLDRAADNAVVYVTRDLVMPLSPTTLFRYAKQGVDLGPLPWMLYPLGAFADKLEHPVAQALLNGAEVLLPAAFHGQTPPILTPSSKDRHSLLKLRVAVCSATQAPHAHFLPNERLYCLANLVGATRHSINQKGRQKAWAAVVGVVQKLVGKLLPSGTVALEQSVEWVLHYLLAITTYNDQKELFGRVHCSFVVKEYPDVYGGDILFARFTDAAQHVAKQVHVHRVQVEVASVQCLREEMGLIDFPEPFENADAAVHSAISGFARKSTLCDSTPAAVQACNKQLAYFLGAVQAVSQMRKEALWEDFSSEDNALKSVQRILDQQYEPQNVVSTASLATTHIMRDTHREKCAQYGIQLWDCRDLYPFWAECGKAARQLRALPFWLPEGFRPDDGVTPAAASGAGSVAAPHGSIGLDF